MQAETHVAPRNPSDNIQSFDTDMFRLQGPITGDPDFDLLRMTAGTGFSLPSPGHTTLTRLPDTNCNVDSFFDSTCRIDFIGAPGGPFWQHDPNDSDGHGPTCSRTEQHGAGRAGPRRLGLDWLSAQAGCDRLILTAILSV